MALELNGTTGVSLVQDGVVTAADLASTLDLTGKTVTLPAGVGGKVLQITQSVLTSAVAATSSTYIDVMSGTITPSSSSSKVLVYFCINIGWGGNGHLSGIILRNGTQIFMGDAAGSRTRDTWGFDPGNGETVSPFPAIYLDSPATTSALTYKLQMKSTPNSPYAFYVNRSASDADAGYRSRTASSIILMEISA
jgi:hypothetical protein